ncbi:MAG: hypothetical protein OXE40_06135 [Gammaproteobacteria bacterium]|nr:hypothetical protein [Gammaproteobacteria bacterium]
MNLQGRFRDGVDPHLDTQSRLGIELPNTHRLAEAIHEDLADGPPHGICWWEPNVNSHRARRILVSDYLYACTANIVHHFLAARLHLLELLDWAEKDERSRNERTRILIPGYRATHPRNVLEYLYTTHIDGHQSGVVLSLASALDCLAAGVVGVCAVPVQIKTTKFGSLRRDLTEDRTKHVTPTSAALHIRVWEQLQSTIKECGPTGWLEWLVQYRNMLVHRGLRQELHTLSVRSELLTADGHPASVVDTAYLPNQPSLSEVEAYLAARSLGALGLSEDAEVTLNGLTKSTMQLAESVAGLLMKVWNDRKKSPQAIPQPFDKLWKQPEEANWSTFPGYGPASDPIEPGKLIQNPTFHKRALAAALDDEQNSLWKKKDMARFIPEPPKTHT